MSNVAPQYGKQTIRFAETFEAGPGEVFEYRLVQDDAGVIEVSDGTGVQLGVNQYYVPSAAENPTASRLLSVATSGVLLVEADGAALPAVGTALLGDTVGRAASAGTAITIDGKAPTIREVVEIGGRPTVLASFS